jgi:hypothetical protein
MTHDRRHFLKQGLIALSLITAGTMAESADAADATPLVVVELFTSQGCSSCPPAEAFLKDLAKRDDVLALEFHVDYWDYIGWKDPFADPAFTARQRHYNTLLGSAYNYTPQMVIDGTAHEVGSRRSAVEARIESAAMKRQMREMGSNPPQMTVTPTAGGGAQITLDGMPQDAESYQILLIGFDAPHETEVLLGENSGKNLVNARVVRSIETLSSNWQGGLANLTLTGDQMKGTGGCAILVQSAKTGAIAAATTLDY